MPLNELALLLTTFSTNILNPLVVGQLVKDAALALLPQRYSPHAVKAVVFKSELLGIIVALSGMNDEYALVIIPSLI